MTLPPRIIAARNVSGAWECLSCTNGRSRHLAFAGMPAPAKWCATCLQPFPTPQTKPNQVTE
jgi:hypothetical protein